MHKDSLTIHLIGNAHIDILWLWKWEEGVQEIRSTFASVLDRIEEHDDFVFTSACAYYYELVEKIDPLLFGRIQEAVKSGKWYIVGGWWLQPDCNAPSGESFVRQGLYGQTYFASRFGVIAKHGYNVDSFGHHGNLPQILKKMEIDTYTYMRPGEHEKSIAKSLFQWKGIDGTKVMTFRIPPNYNNASDWGEGLKAKIDGLRVQAEKESIPLMGFYGVGNHGGGPTKENLRTLDTLIDEDDSIGYSSVGRYFSQIITAEGFPIVEGDLQFHAIGCYSAYSMIKRLNNSAEHLLMRTEKMISVLSAIVEPEKGSYKIMKESWKKVLVNQFHDSLGGCSIPEAYDKVIQSYGWAMESADTLASLSLQKLASRVRTFQSGTTLLVWNPHPWKVTECIDINTVPTSIVNETGDDVVFEIVPTNSIGNEYTHAARVCVQAPPLGYAAYQLNDTQSRLDSGQLRSLQYVRTTTNVIEAGNFSCEIDQETGAIVSLRNVINGKEYLGPKGIRPYVVDDDSDTWSHALCSYRGKRTPMQLKSFQMVSSGPVSTEYEVTYQGEHSLVVLRLKLYQQLDYLDLSTRVLWHEHQKLLQLVIDTPFGDEEINWKTEIPYGAIARPKNGNEYPVQRWSWIGRKDGVGLLVINDGVYSASAEEGALRLTLLRSPIFAHHEPAHPRPDLYPRYMEQGEHQFLFRLIPQGGERSGPNDFGRAALQFNQRQQVLLESIHGGELPLSSSFCELEGDPSLIISTIKRSEADDGWVIRVFESSGQEARGILHLRWLGISKKIVQKPFALQTYFVSDTSKSILECNLLEHPSREIGVYDVY